MRMSGVVLLSCPDVSESQLVSNFQKLSTPLFVSLIPRYHHYPFVRLLLVHNVKTGCELGGPLCIYEEMPS